MSNDTKRALKFLSLGALAMFACCWSSSGKAQATFILNLLLEAVR
jgi:hypothetical protein